MEATWTATILLVIVISIGFAVILARIETRFNKLEGDIKETKQSTVEADKKQSVRITRLESRVKAVVKHLNIEDPVPPTVELPIVPKPA